MNERILRLHQVKEITGLGRFCIYAQMDEGKFPKPLKLTGKSVGWKLSAIMEWIESRPIHDRGAA